MSVILKCDKCGSDVETRWRKQKIYCPPCKKIAARERDESYRERNRHVPVDLRIAIIRKVRNLYVVHDPLEIGGFEPGTNFPKEQWEKMISMLTFTEGTILKDSYGRLYKFEAKGALAL